MNSVATLCLLAWLAATFTADLLLKIYFHKLSDLFIPFLDLTKPYVSCVFSILKWTLLKKWTLLQKSIEKQESTNKSFCKTSGGGSCSVRKIGRHFKPKNICKLYTNMWKTSISLVKFKKQILKISLTMSNWNLHRKELTLNQLLHNFSFFFAKSFNSAKIFRNLLIQKINEGISFCFAQTKSSPEIKLNFVPLEIFLESCWEKLSESWHVVTHFSA